TTLGLEFVYRGATEFDEPGLIVLFEVSPLKVIRDAAQFGWNFPELERRGKIRIIFTTRSVLQQELQQADSLLLAEAAKIGARRIFIDALGPALADLPNGNGDAGGNGHREVFNTLAQALRIVAGRGIEVYRRVQAPRDVTRERAASFDPHTRIATGVPGLDEVVNGGYFLGSTTLVVGVSGVGKSVMGLQYIAEGARRGERGLMFSLDETPAQIQRNAKSLGIELEPQITRGMVRVQYDTPQEIEVDRHFYQIEQMVEDFKPTRVVIDSLSTYGSALGSSVRIFRDFFHAMVALMKQHQVAAI